jgi:hypothetical protein
MKVGCCNVLYRNCGEDFLKVIRKKFPGNKTLRIKGRKPRLGLATSLSRQRSDKNSSLFRLDAFFNGHVFELTRFKNVATFLAFNELSVFFARDNAYAGMSAGFRHRYWFRRMLRDREILTRIHIRYQGALMPMPVHELRLF